MGKALLPKRTVLFCPQRWSRGSEQSGPLCPQQPINICSRAICRTSAVFPTESGLHLNRARALLPCVTGVMRLILVPTLRYGIVRYTKAGNTFSFWIPTDRVAMETRWGKRLGRYEIVSETGRGAMGVVYKARDPKIDRFVAVKAISLIGQNPDEEREYLERFFHEAQAAGRLLHPGIVTIFDVGEEAESRVPYIVMEFVTGQSLNALLSRETKKLPLDTALRLAEELAEALDYAHAQGVVHRDIKPANILITEEGHAKIADFGIAKLNLAHLTIPGHTIGTPAYMSPEQLDGQAVDGRSDLFSLGVVLYNMITGHKPFQGNSAASVCFKVANRDPLPATSFDVGLPPELDAVITRSLAKDPAQRYQRGMEFALDIRELR